jgi:hypothetical protein
MEWATNTLRDILEEDGIHWSVQKSKSS